MAKIHTRADAGRGWFFARKGEKGAARNVEKTEEVSAQHTRLDVKVEGGLRLSGGMVQSEERRTETETENAAAPRRSQLQHSVISKVMDYCRLTDQSVN